MDHTTHDPPPHPRDEGQAGAGHGAPVAQRHHGNPTTQPSQPPVTEQADHWQTDPKQPLMPTPGMRHPRSMQITHCRRRMPRTRDTQAPIPDTLICSDTASGSPRSWRSRSFSPAGWTSTGSASRHSPLDVVPLRVAHDPRETV